ncbi:MAG: hypothetical protein GX620_12845 [Chloroflexi bacterium]|nr:hypothetical protein [Chloroflexota bacterium]
MKGMTGCPVLSACKTSAVSLAFAREWFLDLEQHPDRYRFASHAGFQFSDGGFGEVGAQFSTVERFLGVPIRLKFELTDVATDHFRFRLIRPPFPVWGEFSLQEVATDHTAVVLSLGGARDLGRVFLRLPVVRKAITDQIQREVLHVKESMERARAEVPYARND